jgi:hypothetical protein
MGHERESFLLAHSTSPQGRPCRTLTSSIEVCMFHAAPFEKLVVVKS